MLARVSTGEVTCICVTVELCSKGPMRLLNECRQTIVGCAIRKFANMFTCYAKLMLLSLIVTGFGCEQRAKVSLGNKARSMSTWKMMDWNAIDEFKVIYLDRADSPEVPPGDVDHQLLVDELRALTWRVAKPEGPPPGAPSWRVIAYAKGRQVGLIEVHGVNGEVLYSPESGEFAGNGFWPKLSETLIKGIE